jgi:hypothetical protein
VQAPGRFARSVPGGAAGALLGRERLLAECMRSRRATTFACSPSPAPAVRVRRAWRCTPQLSSRRAWPTAPGGVLLAPVRDARHLQAAIAAALGLQEGGAESLDALVRGYLRLRQTLLVLDNMEHLPQAVTQVRRCSRRVRA